MGGSRESPFDRDEKTNARHSDIKVDNAKASGNKKKLREDWITSLIKYCAMYIQRERGKAIRYLDLIIV
jgi:hypothetical protein